ncbi:MAG: hypothetical protein DM484_15260 [Candidatus Methylumidiphilus alinenensis]|uniref:Uncharacterized protein n=1 Tax=Candidatus Methylumidiphilus alinenensis TaxID=2202197 RepID=A0A2W4SPK8_9GAMM|nr:MAG: hypothetical protein DM484_15260 [Candidatus Methylumidiphilus alinenensis]
MKPALAQGKLGRADAAAVSGRQALFPGSEAILAAISAGETARAPRGERLPDGYTCGGIRRSTAYSALRMSVFEQYQGRNSGLPRIAPDEF